MTPRNHRSSAPSGTLLRPQWEKSVWIHRAPSSHPVGATHKEDMSGGSRRERTPAWDMAYPHELAPIACVECAIWVKWGCARARNRREGRCGERGSRIGSDTVGSKEVNHW